MKRHRTYTAVLGTLLLVLPLVSCGGVDEGSDPSGSVIRVVKVDPVGNALTPDLYLTDCGNDNFEPGLTNAYVTLTLRNDSRPNTPTGQSTNSYVTMGRYRIDYAALNMNVSLPSIDGAGMSLGLPPDSESSVQLLVLDLGQQEYIRSHYPSVGQTDSLTLRAHITMWGEDAFTTTVKAEADFTMVVDDYNRCQ